MSNTHTRRLYLSQADSITDFPQNSGMEVDVAAAQLVAKPGELLATALVRASLPSTLTTVGLTTAKLPLDANGNVDVVGAWHEGENKFPNIQVLCLGTGQFTNPWTTSKQTLHFIVFNDYLELNKGIPNVFLCDWTLQTTMSDLITFINNSISPTDLQISSNEGATHRISVKDPATNCVGFIDQFSTGKIMTAFGMYHLPYRYKTFANVGIPTFIGTIGAGSTEQVSPYQFSVASVMGAVYLKTNLGFDSFISWNGGSNENIIGSISTNVDSNVSGFKITSTTTSNTLVATQDEPLVPAQINYTNFALSGSHKPITNNRVGTIVLELVDDNNIPVGVGSNSWDIVLEFKKIKSYN